MKKGFLLSILVFLLVPALTACGSQAVPSTATARQINIQLTTNPDPARIGDVELILTVTDQSGKPIEGAKVEVTADHTDMSGMVMSGAATEQDGGKYAINANFSMSGNWKITVELSKGELAVKQEIPLVIK